MTAPKTTPEDSAGPTPVRPTLSGRTLNGRFQILEPLGEGGMGKVYKAIQLPLQRPVAVKVLIPPEGGSVDPQFRQRFIREATLASKLRHPGSVRVLDFGDSEGVLFLVMEYLEGMTLAKLLAAAGQLPWRSVALITQGIARALREAHGLGIVHRDLKPSNIMLLGAGDPESVKVLDFGLVKSFIPDEFHGHAPELTTQGMYLGSPAYMAPETARNSADPRSDVYALGVMMFEMLTGRPPFAGVSFLDVAVQHEVEEVPSISQVRPDVVVPPALEAVVRRCLEKTGDRRFQSMQELLDALRPVLEAADVATSTVRTGPHVVLSDSGVRAAALSDSGVHKALRDTGKIAPPRIPTPPALPGRAAQVPPQQPRAQPTPAPVPPMFGSVLGSGAPVDAPPAPPPSAEPALFGADSPKKGGVPGWAIGAGVLVLGAGVAIGFFARPAAAPIAQPASAPEASAQAPATAPAAAPAPTAPTAPAPAVPAVVHFHVGSEPVGAQVVKGDRVLGVTPVMFDLPKDPATGEASAEIELRLKGFEPMTLVLGGPGPDVIVKQRLEKATRRTQKSKLRKVVRYRQEARSAAAAQAGPVVELKETAPTPKPVAPAAVVPPPAPAAAPALAASPSGPAVAGAGGAVSPAVAAPRNVPPFVLDRDLIKREPPHLSDIFKTAHRGMSLSGMYRVCVGMDGHVTKVEPVKSIVGADEEITEGIREGWTFKPQRAPACALYTVPVTVK